MDDFSSKDAHTNVEYTVKTLKLLIITLPFSQKLPVSLNIIKIKF